MDGREASRAPTMIDQRTTIGELKDLVRTFSRERGLGTVPPPQGPGRPPWRARSARSSSTSATAATRPSPPPSTSPTTVVSWRTSWPTASGCCSAWPTSARSTSPLRSAIKWSWPRRSIPSTGPTAAPISTRPTAATPTTPASPEAQDERWDRGSCVTRVLPGWSRSGYIWVTVGPICRANGS